MHLLLVAILALLAAAPASAAPLLAYTDTRNGSTIQPVKPDTLAPLGSALRLPDLFLTVEPSPDGNAVAVATDSPRRGGEVAIVDARRARTVGTVKLPGRDYARGLAWVRADRLLVAGHARRRRTPVYVVDTRRGRLVRTVQVSGRWAGARRAGARLLLVRRSPGFPDMLLTSVTADGRDGPVVKLEGMRQPLVPDIPEGELTGITVLPVGEDLYVLSRTGPRIARVDLAAGEAVIEAFPLPQDESTNEFNYYWVGARTADHVLVEAAGNGGATHLLLADRDTLEVTPSETPEPGDWVTLGDAERFLVYSDPYGDLRGLRAFDADAQPLWSALDGKRIGDVCLAGRYVYATTVNLQLAPRGLYVLDARTGAVRRTVEREVALLCPRVGGALAAFNTSAAE